MQITQQALDAAQQVLLASWQSTNKAAVSSTPTTIYGHGNGGLFSNPALERPLFSAMVLPRQGLLSRLNARPNPYASPLYGIVTGVTATTDTGSPTEATMGPCDDPPVAGLMKLCEQTIYFGRQSRMTRVFELDRMGLLSNRGEHTDFQLMNTPFGLNETGAATPTVPGLGGNTMVNSEVGKALFEFATAWSRDFAAEVYTGNPTNNAPLGGRKYFRGMDLLINTGYKDAITNVACPAADSIVRSAGNINISTDANGARQVYRNITDIFRQLRINGNNMGFNQVKWVLVMRPTLFYELTEIWPVVYATNRGLALTSSSTPINSSWESLDKMRTDMRGDLYNFNGQFLLIDGIPLEVVLDDAIAETNVGSGTYSSAIYFVPLTANGAEVLTLEYVPYTGAGVSAAGSFMEAANAFGVGSFYNTSDNGRFAWHFKPPTNFCVQMLAKTEPRLVLRTPYLAARYTTIRYTPVSHERDWDTAGTYFVNGGSTNYNGLGPSYNTPT